MCSSEGGVPICIHCVTPRGLRSAGYISPSRPARAPARGARAVARAARQARAAHAGGGFPRARPAWSRAGPVRRFAVGSQPSTNLTTFTNISAIIRVGLACESRSSCHLWGRADACSTNDDLLLPVPAHETRGGRVAHSHTRRAPPRAVRGSAPAEPGIDRGAAWLRRAP